MVTYVEYLSCPFCSRNIYLPKIDAALMANLEQDPATQWFLYQVREARGGKGSNSRIDKIWGRQHRKAEGGFYLVPSESKTIIQMMEDERLRPYAKGILERLKVIIDSYTKAGLLSAEDLKV